MKPNSLRRYSLESRITPGIAAYLRNAPEQVNQSEGDLSAAAAIPSSDALIKFKDDMEKLIPHSYNRLASLKHDLIQIERLADPSRKVFSDEPINGAVVKEEDSGKDIAAVTQDKTRSQSTGIESKAERDKMEPLSTRQNNGTSTATHIINEAPTEEPSTRRKKQATQNTRQLPPQTQFTASSDSAPDDLDFVRMKPKDQVSIHTFWGAVDPLFRPLSEEDRLFLLEKGDNVKPYIIPPLGRHYSQVWADEDKRYGIPPSLDENSFNDSISQSSKKPFTKGSASTKRADAMMRGAHRGNLIDRLLSSLVQEDIVDESSLLHESNTTHTPTEEAKGSGSGDLQVWPCESYDIINLEERMRRELRYVGLLSADEIDFDAQEDDEICAELRAAGRELQKQVKENEFRKARLLDIVDQQLQYEQYRQMLEKLNSQVEQSYMKRFRTHTSKKRKTASSAKINAAYAMQRRNTWINSLDDIFRNKNLILPEESIYKQQD